MDRASSLSRPPDPRSRRTVLRTLSGVGLATLAGIAGCLDSETSPGGTDRTSTDTTTSDHSSSTASDPSIDVPSFAAWTYQTPHGALGTLSLAPAGDGPAVYVGSDSADGSSGSNSSDGGHALHALRLEDGTERWRTDLPHPVRTEPTYGGNDGPQRLYLATGPESLHGRETKLRAIDPASGDQVWTFDTDETRFVYPLDATDDAVFVGRRDDQIGRDGEYVYAVDAADGTERWRTETGDADEDGSQVRRDTLYVTVHGRLRAIDPESGEERWRFDPGELLDGPAFGSQGERVFVGTDGVVRALSTADGSEVWRREFDFTVSGVTRPQMAASTTVYVGDYDGRLLALSPLSGETRWTAEVDADQFSPVVHRTSETLFVGGSRVYALDPVSGDEQWSFVPDEKTHLGVQASTTVFAVDGKRDRITALDPASGETRWQFAPDANIAGVASAGDLAFVGVEGTVLALDGATAA